MGGWYTMGPDDGPAEKTAPEPRKYWFGSTDDDSIELPPYRTLETRARWSVILLSLTIVASAVAVALGGIEASLLGDIEAGRTVTDAQLDASDRNTFVIGVVEAVLQTFTAIAFLAWFYRAYVNLEALGAQDRRFGRKWAIGGWFVPVLALWRPKQVANDIWRGSDPESPRINWGWHEAPVSNLLLGWWILWTIAEVIYRQVLLSSRAANDIDALQSINSRLLLADLVSIAAAILAILVVRRMTARQESRASVHQLAFAVDEPSWYRTGVGWLTVLAALAALLLQGLIFIAVWHGTPAAGTSGQITPPPPSTDGPALVSEDFSDTGGGWGTETSAEYIYEYIGGEYRIMVKQKETQRHAYRELLAPLERVGLEISARLAEGARPDGYGLACWADDSAYLASVYTDGYWQILRSPGSGDEQPSLLVSGTDRRGTIKPGDVRNDVQFECRGGGTSQATFSLSVNGRELATAKDESPLPKFTRVGFFVESVEGRTDVRFDNFNVRLY